MKYVFVYFLSLVIFSSCVETQHTFSKLPPGYWRAALYLNGTSLPINTADETSQINEIDGELPFNIEVVYENENSFFINIINGDEVIKVSDIVYGLDRSTAKDTIIINFSEFDTYIKAIYEEGIMEGDWYVNYKENYKIPFKAYHGHKNRFPLKNEEPNFDVSGNWDTRFEIDTEDEYPAVGQFKQNGKNIRGTFTTETGDYRYLDGMVFGNKMKLSTFDGSHAFLFEAKILNQDSIIGIFRSGKHYTSNWVAVPSKDSLLKNPYDLTKNISDDNVNFSLKNSNGELTSLTDNRFEGKAKIIQIMGTWCPNCKDETNFLSNYYRTKKPENLEIISIGFERYEDDSKSLKLLENYKNKMKIPYELLLGGYFDKSEVIKIFPQLDKIYSYPTLIFLDKNNKIKNIYTGYYGPATLEHDKFIEEFYNNVENLIND
jgi:thiol-disulfide isomerase/thioredoxin